jgi:hypothetical protein
LCRGPASLKSWAELVERHRFVCIIAFQGLAQEHAGQGCRRSRAQIARARGLRRSLLLRDGGLSALAPETAQALLGVASSVVGLAGRDAGEAVLRYERPGAIFSCEPAGLDQASRGRRGNLLVLDDVSDPKKLASMADIQRALEALQRRILPLLKDKSARVLLVGTPLIEGDVIAWAEKNSEFVTTRLPAILPTALPRGRKSIRS